MRIQWYGPRMLMANPRPRKGKPAKVRFRRRSPAAEASRPFLAREPQPNRRLNMEGMT